MTDGWTEGQQEPAVQPEAAEDAKTTAIVVPPQAPPQVPDVHVEADVRPNPDRQDRVAQERDLRQNVAAVVLVADTHFPGIGHRPRSDHPGQTQYVTLLELASLNRTGFCVCF